MSNLCCPIQIYSSLFLGHMATRFPILPCSCVRADDKLWPVEYDCKWYVQHPCYLQNIFVFFSWTQIWDDLSLTMRKWTILQSRSWQAMACKANLTCGLILYGPWAESGLKFFNGWEWRKEGKEGGRAGEGRGGRREEIPSGPLQEMFANTCFRGLLDSRTEEIWVC